ncbi:hypothetical protein [Kineococcus sp. SYSU DK004]|uniref:hypothetical protein n=1 Tax=Kineococcus sp. SYSU DK004 TaxID=3383125 RepID=UPI003D7CF9C6
MRGPSPSAPPPSVPSRDGRAGATASTALLLLVVVLTALATYSVVRYRWWLVAGYLVTAAALALVLARERPGAARPGAREAVPAAAVAGALGLAALAHALVPVFSYVEPPLLRAVRAGLAVATAVVAALLLVAGRGGPRSRVLGRAALLVALAAAGGAGAAVVVGDPAPRIDVWVILQQAADAVGRGESVYTQTWTGSPGITDAFAYLPFTAVLTAPGRWLAGDVRWALLLLVGVSALAVAALGRWRVPAVGAAALLLLAPGATTLVEQAWTEPTVLVGVALWALLVARGRAWWAVLPLAVALAAKQHTVLLLPLLAVHPAFGARRTLAAVGTAGLLVLPWFVTAPAAFWRDTVETMVGLPPLTFANTAYTLVLNETGRSLPLPLVAAAVLGALAAAVVVLRRRPVDLGGLLGWSALVLLVANLVNKQAFYNQFWLVAAVLLLAVAARAGATATGAPAGGGPGGGRVADVRPARGAHR